MKNKKLISFILILLMCMPYNILAYSDYIIPGGENIGIEINTKGILVVGTYDVNGDDIAKKAGIKTGDIIIKIDNKEVYSIDDLINSFKNQNNEVEVTLKRQNTTYKTKLEVVLENGVTKTGLYVKDSITGIGTLSYIDPGTSIYGALGHEILEQNTGKLLEVKDGKIVSSTVTNIERSENGFPGSKNAIINDLYYGDISKNTSSGIFGEYKDKIPNKKKYKVASKENIELGKAKILTVINKEEVKEYNINIIKITDDKNKNILFEITDKELLEQTGGIVQGMSGSPIIQGDYIIGAVTHVVVDDPSKGYGIFIVNMLEEGERDI